MAKAEDEISTLSRGEYAGKGEVIDQREIEDKLYARPGPLAKSSRPRFEPPASRGREALVEIGRTYNVGHMMIFRLKAQHAAR